MPTGPKTEPKLTREDRRPGADPKSMRSSRTAERRKAKQRNGDRTEDATPKGIGKPGRFRFLPGLLRIGVVLLDWYLREWAVPMLRDPRLRPVAYDMEL